MIGPTVVLAPAVTPVSIDDVKNQIIFEADDYDAKITGLIAAATALVEGYTGLSLITRTYKGWLDYWPTRQRGASVGSPGGQWAGNGIQGWRPSVLELPRPPLQSVTYIKTYDDSDVATTMDPATYFVDPNGIVGRIATRNNVTWPTPARTANGIEIEWVAGFGDTSEAVPGDFKHAILLLCSHWIEHTEAVVGVDNRDSSTPLPLGVAELIGPHRVYSFV